jgi:hypothetical protein
MTFLTDRITAIEPTEHDAEITAKMCAAGFRLENMGGNVQAWQRDAGNAYILVSFSDGFAFGAPDDDAWCACIYRDEESEPLGELLGDMLTIDGAIERASEMRL